MKEENIVFESDCGKFYVYKIASGRYEINKNGITHATRVALICYLDDSTARDRAIEICLEKALAFK